MRLRNVRGAREEMLVNPYVIQEPQQYKGHVAVQIFGNNNPIFIEVGMGKGQSLDHDYRTPPRKPWRTDDPYVPGDPPCDGRAPGRQGNLSDPHESCRSGDGGQVSRRR